MAGLEDYGFGPKNNYRRQVWGSLRSIIRRGIREGAMVRHLFDPGGHWLPSPRGVTEAHVAMLPSSQGIEVAVAESMGFQRTHIHAIDDNPAKVAWASRRFPGIRTYGFAVPEAMRRIVREHALEGVNLDLCGGATMASREALEGVTRLMAVRHAVGITVFRGRERGTTSAWGMMRDPVNRAWCRDHILPVMKRTCVNGEDRLSENDAVRLWFMLAAFRLQPDAAYIVLDRVGIYHSTSARGRHTMLWATLDLTAVGHAMALAILYARETRETDSRRWAHLAKSRAMNRVYGGPLAHRFT